MVLSFFVNWKYYTTVFPTTRQLWRHTFHDSDSEPDALLGFHLLSCSRYCKPSTVKQSCCLVIYEPWLRRLDFSTLSRSCFSNTIPSPMTLEVVKKIAEKHGKTPAQILLRHALQRGLIIIPKSSHPDRVVSNIQVS